jgi:hypothetical protein
MNSITRLRTFLPLSFLFLVSISSSGQEPASAPGERKFNNKTFKDLPVSVLSVQNLQSDTWPKELRIQIKNTSNKPIFFILAHLIFPDDPAPTGVSGIPLEYGKPDSDEVGKDPDPDAEHLKPGDTFLFAIPESLEGGLTKKNQRAPETFQRMEFQFDLIIFGDGTGFESGRPSEFKPRTP